MAGEEAGSARPQAGEILGRVLTDAENELGRAPVGLGFSGVAAGITIGLSSLGVAILETVLGGGSWQHLAAYALYPVGFLAVILGRGQLFTENTLYPVVLLLDRREGWIATARLWLVVFVSNHIGVFLFATLMTQTTAIEKPVQHALVALGTAEANHAFWHVFWTGVVAGWLIALVAWLVEGSESSIGQIVLIWLLTFVLGVGAFAHCIASAGPIASALLDGSVGVGEFFRWLAAATAGNIAGGVLIVAILNYGQVMASARGTASA